MVFEAVARLCETRGIEIAGSELIGMIPEAALGRIGRSYLKWENLRPGTDPREPSASCGPALIPQRPAPTVCRFAISTAFKWCRWRSSPISVFSIMLYRCGPANLSRSTSLQKQRVPDPPIPAGASRPPRFPLRQNPAHLLAIRRIKKDVISIRPVAQKPRRPASDDHRVPLLRNLRHDLLEKDRQMFRIQQFKIGRWQTGLEAPAHKRLHQPVEHRIAALLAGLNQLGLALEPARDLGGDVLIPELPPQPIRNRLRDIRSAAPYSRSIPMTLVREASLPAKLLQRKGRRTRRNMDEHPSSRVSAQDLRCSSTLA